MHIAGSEIEWVLGPYYISQNFPSPLETVGPKEAAKNATALGICCYNRALCSGFGQANE